MSCEETKEKRYWTCCNRYGSSRVYLDRLLQKRCDASQKSDFDSRNAKSLSTVMLIALRGLALLVKECCYWWYCWKSLISTSSGLSEAWDYASASQIATSLDVQRSLDRRCW